MSVVECEECDLDNANPYIRSTRHFNLQDEVYKLRIIIISSDKPLHRNYVEEKLNALLRGDPILLDASKHGLFNDWKRMQTSKQPDV